MNFSQASDEPIHEACDRFQELLQQRPHHQMAQELLWQFFYDGLKPKSEFLVDSTIGGNIVVKIAYEIKEIFETLVASSQQKSCQTRIMEAIAVIACPNLKKQMADMKRELQELKMAKSNHLAQPVLVKFVARTNMQ